MRRWGESIEAENFTCLDMVSDNCFDITGAASAGLPGLTIGEQIGGMWKSIAEKNKIHVLSSYKSKQEKKVHMREN